jgi:iron complex outermembrane receptor protein
MTLTHGIAPSRARHDCASGTREYPMKKFKGNSMTHRFKFSGRAITLALTALGALAAADSFAQEAGQPGLAEIIVTAQKREQNIQDVPISVISVSEAQIKAAGITDIKNLTILTPGLTVTSTTSENVTSARIRGIGTVGDNPGLESSVGVVIDGVYRPRNGVGFGNLGEIDRTEVLEGPQGELFGKNNDAGVINIVTKRPSTTFGVTAEATYGNYNDRELSASITGPIGGISAARLYVGWQKREGFSPVETGIGPNTDNRSNDRDVWTVRGQYQMTPTDDLTLLLIADYSKRQEHCCDAVPVVDGPFAGIVNALTGVPALGGNGSVGIQTGTLTPFTQRAYANQPIRQDIRDTGFSGQIDWDLHFGKLTSITAWRDNTIINGNDSDYTGADIIDTPATKGNQTDFKQFSEEVRLAGKQGPLDWLVGGFFSSEILTPSSTVLAGRDFDLYVGGVASASVGANPPNFLLIPGFTGNLPGGTFIPGVSGQADWFRQTSKSYAFFTDETYNIMQGLDLTGGLRVTKEKKSADSHFSNPDGGIGTGSGCGKLLTSPGVNALNPLSPEYQFLIGYGCATPFNPFFNGLSSSQSLDEAKASGTVKLSYRFTDDIMAYLSWADGYKAGGYNLARVTNPAAANPLAPVLNTFFPEETVNSYELGVKSTFANRTVRLNAALFRQDYNNFQLNTFTGIVFVVSSIKKVQSKGAELNADWATPLRGLNLSGGLTYAFTNIEECGEACYLFAPDRLNSRMPFAPLWSGVASAAYIVPLSSALQLRANVSDKYTSSYNTGSNLKPQKLQSSYGILNARLALEPPDSKWAVEIWGNNLADKGYYQVAFDAPFQYQQIDSFMGDPRTFGITFRVKF